MGEETHFEKLLIISITSEHHLLQDILSESLSCVCIQLLCVYASFIFMLYWMLIYICVSATRCENRS